MAKKKKTFSVEDIDFSKEKPFGAWIRILLAVAKECPTHAEEVFDKFIDFQCRKNPNKKKEEVTNDTIAHINWSLEFYTAAAREILSSTYKNLKNVREK